MCGIAGIIRTKGSLIGEEDVARLRRAGVAMQHRGPDDNGVLICKSGIAAFAHRRLAIIDPTAEAHQPMESASGSTLVFNGEIYNYRELVSTYKLRVPPSDTAVLLSLLDLRGISVLKELRGFFTFAYWNDRERKLIIARDPFGKKPLYYSHHAGSFVFASEIRPLIASGLVPFELSQEGLSAYLRYYSVPHPHSMVEGVSSLEPGSVLSFESDKMKVERWYRLPEHHDSKIRYEDAVRETRRILERSVQDRLVSDVPVGVFLSGGLDSNAITALAAPQTSFPMETFSVGFTSRHVESETEWAKIGAAAYGTVHHDRNFNGSDVANLLPEFFSSMDSPTGDGLNTFLVAKTARKYSPSLKVVLSGVGGDEAFLGYAKYRAIARKASLIKSAKIVPMRVRESISESLLAAGHTRIGSAVRTVLTPQNSRALFAGSEIERLTGERFENSPLLDLEKDAVVSMLRSDLEHYLPDMLLRDLDAMTMKQSLEARAPFLDRELLEFCWQLPFSVKLHGTTKQLLADSVRDVLPKALLSKPKTGFELPMAEWLKTDPLRPYLDSLQSSDSKLVEDGILSRAGLLRVYDAFVRGRFHYLKPWSIIALDQWYRRSKELSQGAYAQPAAEVLV